MRDTGRWFRSPRWVVACAVLAAGFLAAATYSLAASPPLGIRLRGLQTAGRSDRVRQLTIRVANRSGSDLRPAFDVLRSGRNTSFWTVVAGPRHLAGGQVANYTLLAPNADAEPSVQGTFTVIGFVASPRSFAVSDEYDAALYRLSTRHHVRGSHSLDLSFGGR